MASRIENNRAKAILIIAAVSMLLILFGRSHSFTYEGRVINAYSKMPVVGAAISIDDTSKLTDKSGGFRFKSLNKERVIMTVDAPGYIISKVAVDHHDGMETIAIHRSSINGKIVNKDKEPIVGAEVRFNGQALRTDPKGNFFLPDIPLGLKSLFVTASGYRPISRNLTLASSSLKVNLAMLTETAQPSRSGDKNLTAYITIDDGPDPEFTPKILKILDKYRIKATFFPVGYKIAAHPELIRRELVAGHAVGNHSYSHDYRKLYRSGLNAFRDDLEKNEALLASITGERSKIMRAPGGTAGNFSPGHFAAMKAAGYRIVGWTVTTGDGDLKTTADAMISNMIGGVSTPIPQRNPIILMHDTHPETIEALPKIIEYLLDRGYKFAVVTASEPPR